MEAFLWTRRFILCRYGWLVVERRRSVACICFACSGHDGGFGVRVPKCNVMVKYILIYLLVFYGEDVSGEFYLILHFWFCFWFFCYTIVVGYVVGFGNPHDFSGCCCSFLSCSCGFVVVSDIYSDGLLISNYCVFSFGLSFYVWWICIVRRMMMVNCFVQV